MAHTRGAYSAERGHGTYMITDNIWGRLISHYIRRLLYHREVLPAISFEFIKRTFSLLGRYPPDRQPSVEGPYASNQVRCPRGAKEHYAERWEHAFCHQAILILRSKRERGIEHTKTRYKITDQGCPTVCYAIAYVSEITSRCNHLFQEVASSSLSAHPRLSI